MGKYLIYAVGFAVAIGMMVVGSGADGGGGAALIYGGIGLCVAVAIWGAFNGMGWRTWGSGGSSGGGGGDAGGAAGGGAGN